MISSYALNNYLFVFGIKNWTIVDMRIQVETQWTGRDRVILNAQKKN